MVPMIHLPVSWNIGKAFVIDYGSVGFGISCVHRMIGGPLNDVA